MDSLFFLVIVLIAFVVVFVDVFQRWQIKRRIRKRLKAIGK
jgi:hypothetical protein